MRPKKKSIDCTWVGIDERSRWWSVQGARKTIVEGGEEVCQEQEKPLLELKVCGEEVCEEQGKPLLKLKMR